jgi:hypothetical protein
MHFNTSTPTPLLGGIPESISLNVEFPPDVYEQLVGFVENSPLFDQSLVITLAVSLFLARMPQRESGRLLTRDGL